MAQKDVGNKVPIYKLKETKEVMDFYDEWGLDNKYDKDMVEWNYTGPKETAEVFNKHQKEKDIIFEKSCAYIITVGIAILIFFQVLSF